MDWLKHKKIYFSISIIMVLIGAFSLINWKLRLGVDFTGGTIVEYKVKNETSADHLASGLREKEVELNSVQATSDNIFLLKLPPISEEDRLQTASKTAELVGSVEELRFETVGPSIGPELVKKTFVAIAISAGLILAWVAYQFKNPRYGVSAILAMLHDSFILLGVFSLLGHFYNVEIDFLFVTALLTTLSFSVHDTIVVFDRIREISKKEGGELVDVSNRALTETMVRSLNNSFTIMFMLAALILLGGTTVRWFAAALLVGTILGTYSSPFVAVPLLNSMDGLVEKFKSYKITKKR